MGLGYIVGLGRMQAWVWAWVSGWLFGSRVRVDVTGL